MTNNNAVSCGRSQMKTERNVTARMICDSLSSHGRSSADSWPTRSSWLTLLSTGNIFPNQTSHPVGGDCFNCSRRTGAAPHGDSTATPIVVNSQHLSETTGSGDSLCLNLHTTLANWTIFSALSIPTTQLREIQIDYTHLYPLCITTALHSRPIISNSSRSK